MRSKLWRKYEQRTKFSDRAIEAGSIEAGAIEAGSIEAGAIEARGIEVYITRSDYEWLYPTLSDLLKQSQFFDKKDFIKWDSDA